MQTLQNILLLENITRQTHKFYHMIKLSNLCSCYILSSLQPGWKKSTRNIDSSTPRFFFCLNIGEIRCTEAASSKILLPGNALAHI